MKFFTITSLVILAFACTTDGRTFTKCELAREFYYEHQFTWESLPDWICLTEFESSFNTTAVNGPNTNDSYDFGLFQINNNWWCVIGEPGHDCNVDCLDLIDEDITDDVACARIIFEKRGFEAWNGWKGKCQGELPSVDECFVSLK